MSAWASQNGSYEQCCNNSLPDCSRCIPLEPFAFVRIGILVISQSSDLTCSFQNGAYRTAMQNLEKMGLGSKGSVAWFLTTVYWTITSGSSVHQFWSILQSWMPPWMVDLISKRRKKPWGSWFAANLRCRPHLSQLTFWFVVFILSNKTHQTNKARRRRNIGKNM